MLNLIAAVNHKEKAIEAPSVAEFRNSDLPGAPAQSAQPVPFFDANRLRFEGGQDSPAP
jgi:hypothetical protein